VACGGLKPDLSVDRRFRRSATAALSSSPPRYRASLRRPWPHHVASSQLRIASYVILEACSGLLACLRTAARPPVEAPAPRLPPHQRRAVARCRGLWLLWVRELWGLSFGISPSSADAGRDRSPARTRQRTVTCRHSNALPFLVATALRKEAHASQGVSECSAAHLFGQAFGRRTTPARGLGDPRNEW
jgi:hypothetical protein